MSKRIYWMVDVPKHLDDQLKDYLAKDAYKTKSEFIRVAVRDRLREEFKRLQLPEKQKELAEGGSF